MCCSVLQCVAVCCSVLQCASVFMKSEEKYTERPPGSLQQTATHCNTLQHAATNCNTLQNTATHCNTRQHTATHYISCMGCMHMYTAHVWYLRFARWQVRGDERCTERPPVSTKSLKTPGRPMRLRYIRSSGS